MTRILFIVLCDQEELFELMISWFRKKFFQIRILRHRLFPGKDELGYSYGWDLSVIEMNDSELAKYRKVMLESRRLAHNGKDM